jgi:hypothetical protein
VVGLRVEIAFSQQLVEVDTFYPDFAEERSRPFEYFNPLNALRNTDLESDRLL